MQTKLVTLTDEQVNSLDMNLDGSVKSAEESYQYLSRISKVKVIGYEQLYFWGRKPTKHFEITYKD